MTAGTIATYVHDAEQISNKILEAIQGISPEAAVPAATAEVVIDLVAELASKALAAWQDASGTPITPETVAALLPNAAPLSEPDPAA